MKHRIIFLLSFVLLSLLVVPVTHILFAPNWSAVKWSEQSFLYNVDFALRWAIRALYPLGISIAPEQAIIGRDNWLYLGDAYGKTISLGRRPPTSADADYSKQIGYRMEGWDAYFASKGVKLFRIMVAPNKKTIYPEYMPDWAKPASPNATYPLIAGTGAQLFVDLKSPMLAAKASQPIAQYFKTDTHWNLFGATIAFRAFAQQVGVAAPDIRWPSDATYELTRIVPRTGGDLARFLRLASSLFDSDPATRVFDLPLEITQFDFDSKQVVYQGANVMINMPVLNKPQLVNSVGALNDKKVLWLRDSFGTALSPFMAVTFSQVLHILPHEMLSPVRVLQLVEEWKPDYIFLTVVERDFGIFRMLESTPPPPVEEL